MIPNIIKIHWIVSEIGGGTDAMDAWTDARTHARTSAVLKFPIWVKDPVGNKNHAIIFNISILMVIATLGLF